MTIVEQVMDAAMKVNALKRIMNDALKESWSNIHSHRLHVAAMKSEDRYMSAVDEWHRLVAIAEKEANHVMQ